MSLGTDLELTWLGHGSFRIDMPTGESVLLDPWLVGNPSCPERLEKVDRADAILVTHGHFDHLSEVPALAAEHDSLVVANFEIAAWLEKRGLSAERLVGMNLGGTTDVLPGLSATMVRADHSSGIQDADGNVVYGGEASGYVVHREGSGSIYFAGDTALFGDMKLIGELYSPVAAVLPIGDRFTMGPRDAAHAARLVGARKIVPCHYGTFPMLTGTPAELRDALEGEATVVEAVPGEPIP